MPSFLAPDSGSWLPCFNTSGLVFQLSGTHDLQQVTAARMAQIVNDDVLMPPVWSVCLVFCFAAFAQGMVGYGQAFVWNSGMRILATLYGSDFDPRRNLSLWCVGEIGIAVALKLMVPQAVHWPTIFRVGIPMLCATYVGNYILRILGDNTLQHLLGMLIVVFATCVTMGKASARLKTNVRIEHAYLNYSPQFLISPSHEPGTHTADRSGIWIWFVALAAGGAAGLLGGSVGITGPPLVFFFSRTHLDRDVLHSTFQSLVLVMNTMSCLLLSQQHSMDIQGDFHHFVAVWLGAALGISVSAVAFHKVAGNSFEFVLLVVYLFGGCILFRCGDVASSCFVFAVAGCLLALSAMVASALGPNEQNECPASPGLPLRRHSRASEHRRLSAAQSHECWYSERVTCNGAAPC